MGLLVDNLAVALLWSMCCLDLAPEETWVHVSATYILGPVQRSNCYLEYVLVAWLRSIKMSQIAKAHLRLLLASKDTNISLAK